MPPTVSTSPSHYGNKLVVFINVIGVLSGRYQPRLYRLQIFSRDYHAIRYPASMCANAL